MIGMKNFVSVQLTKYQTNKHIQSQENSHNLIFREITSMDSSNQ